MSNDVAIASVTATLKYVLQEGVSRNGTAIEVTTLPPNTEGEGIPELGVNLYLYRITPNVAMANSDLRPRRPKGDVIKRFQSALDLHYLITFYGDEAKLETQKLSGIVIRTLMDNAILTPEMITQAIALSTDPDLERSDLTDQSEQVKVTPTSLSTDELSKIWSTLVQTPYRLCLAYQASVVMLESNKPGELPLPLRESRFHIFSEQPVIERILPDTGQRQPILADSTLLIQGKQLAGLETRVQLGSQKFLPQSVTPNQITLSLAALPREELRAGLQSVQIIHLKPSGPDLLTITALESNAVALVLCPTIQFVRVDSLQINRKGIGDGQITVGLDLPVGTVQGVLLLLNETGSNSQDGLSNYIFRAERREVETHSVVFLLQNVKIGSYLVRVQVDGAESPLGVDTNPQSVNFDKYFEPQLVIEEMRTPHSIGR
ncbi:hypothetical protein NIES4074_42590 [Cylindrospermum sp. NIES-4074]|nr:hypothetical protein NIES4074_42590 [Cylindrospermum sp. NIES-4074]